MWSETGTSTFSTPESFADTLRSVRLALDTRGLCVLSELDLAKRVKQTLGMHLPPCRILYVWPNPSLEKHLCPAVAVILPLHVVVASRDHHTDISVLGRIQFDTDNADDFIRSPVLGTQRGIMKSLEAISMHPSHV